MRLKLTVERQEHPPTRILWNADTLRPNHTGDRGHTTIAQLLEQINEVIQLEAADWGLDDYVVEVNGYECFHFCSIQIFKEDEEVTVRPLQASDLRYRKISGRHQISVDGKHLIDGVAFGRPFLRRTDRPAIRIPPRKRIRLTYNDDENEAFSSELLNRQQILVRSNSNDADNEDSEDDEEDADYAINQSDDTDLASELDDLVQDLHHDVKGFEGAAEEHSGRITRSRMRGEGEGLGIQSLEPLDLFEHDQSQYAGKYHNPLLDQYYQEESAQRRKKTKHKRGIKDQRLSANTVSKINPTLHLSRRSSSTSLKGVRFEDNEVETPATIRQISDSGPEDDEGSFSHNGSAAVLTESNKENVQPGYMARHRGSVHYDIDGKVSYTSDDESPNAHDSSSVSSDTDSTSSDGSSESSFSPDNSSSPEENKSPDRHFRDTQVDGGSQESFSSLVNQSEDLEMAPQPSSIAVPPGQGKSRTKKRNERRRVRTKIQYLKRIGVLSSKANTQDYDMWLRQRRAGNEALYEDVEVDDGDTSMAFEQRKKNLLDSVRFGGSAANVDVGFETGDEDFHGSELHRDAAEHSITEMNATQSVGHNSSSPLMAERTYPNWCNRDNKYHPVGRSILDNGTILAKEDACTQCIKHNYECVAWSERAACARCAAQGNTRGMCDLRRKRQIDEIIDALSAVDEVRSSTGNNGDEIMTDHINPQVSTVVASNTMPNIAPSSALVESSVVAAPLSTTPKKRARLDLPSSRRLLFGSLGLRAPKTKEEEIKLREQIMKNAKPTLQVTKNMQLAPNAISSDNDKEDESWKDRIILKAVECCYEGVELSTPPFPFVQRWDPQQQWGNGEAKSGGKTRKRKRNQKSNPYDEDKNRMGNRVEYYHQDEADDDDDIYDAPCKGPEPDEFASKTSSERLATVDSGNQSAQPYNNEQLQNAVDEQLMRDTKVHDMDDVPLDSEIPNSLEDDLQQLPEDLSTLYPLTVNAALPGTTIAFKQLDMSQETSWQPRVSEYRTAIINKVLESGSFELALAQRDRPRRDKLYDTDTGERIYSKFEMPDYEDEEVDEGSGILHLSLANMIDPKLVVKAQGYIPLSLQTQEPEIEVLDMSAIPDMDEDNREPTHAAPAAPILEDNSTAVEDGTEVQDVLLMDASEELPYHLRGQSGRAEIVHVTEESRQEISLIMKDAGFRSNVHSDLERGIDDHTAPADFNEHSEDVAGIPEARSPKFNGFSSSPPAEEDAAQEPNDEQDSGPTIISNINNMNIVSIEDSQSQDGMSTLNGPADDLIENAIEEAMDAFDGYSEPPANKENLPYPALPSQLDGTRSSHHHEIISSSPPSARITKRGRHLVNGRSLKSHNGGRRSMLEEESSDDLPTIQDVLSTAPSRIEEPHTAKAKRAGVDKAGQNKYAKSQTNSPKYTSNGSRPIVRPFSAADIFVTSSASSADEDSVRSKDAARGTVALSQPPPGSQVVDLTLSSDPVDPDGSEYEERHKEKGFGLPSGPGWVKKTRSAGKRSLGRKLGTRKTKSM
ncbi:hypothetical protein MMC13_005129 [Lambiella insularis]|nr:hypothetical protein [Lambiella insularis]